MSDDTKLEIAIAVLSEKMDATGRAVSDLKADIKANIEALKAERDSDRTYLLREIEKRATKTEVSDLRGDHTALAERVDLKADKSELSPFRKAAEWFLIAIGGIIIGLIATKLGIHLP